MKIGAVIVAAGLSSRMGDFKPLMDMGERSVIGSIVATLQSGGILDIVVVTGHRAEDIMAHLCGKATFLHNSRYKTTDMFRSAKIGLEYMAKYDGVVFTPCDIPLFSPETVKALVSSLAKGQYIYPTCDGRRGHPILIRGDLISTLVSYEGDGGLRGAIESSGASCVAVEVSDKGTLYDADTREDYERLLQIKERQNKQE